MQIIHAHGIPEQYKTQIEEILICNNNDFSLPLFEERTSGLPKTTRDQKSNQIINNCLNRLCKQLNNIVVDNGQVVAFMSYVKDTVTNPDIYILDLNVRLNYKDSNCVYELYHYLMEQNPMIKIRTRVRSIDDSHLNILLSHNFKEYRRLKNGCGEGIDIICLES